MGRIELPAPSGASSLSGVCLGVVSAGSSNTPSTAETTKLSLESDIPWGWGASEASVKVVRDTFLAGFLDCCFDLEDKECLSEKLRVFLSS